MKIDLFGSKVLVTGASRGIGKAIAQQFLNAGATVGVHYVKNKKKAEEIRKNHSNAYLFQADLADEKASVELFENVLAKMGKLDVLVNNAGIALSSPFNNTNWKDWLSTWNATMKVNLNHTALLSMLMIEHARQHEGKARIVNITSRAAFRGDTKDYLAYASSKGGLVAFTRSIAREFGKEGIIAFNIAPGFTRTEMAEDFIRKYGEEYATHDLSLPTLTTPEDISPIVVFLASGMADHATGSTIDINAGSYIH